MAIEKHLDFTALCMTDDHIKNKMYNEAMDDFKVHICKNKHAKINVVRVLEKLIDIKPFELPEDHDADETVQLSDGLFNTYKKLFRLRNNKDKPATKKLLHEQIVKLYKSIDSGVVNSKTKRKKNRNERDVYEHQHKLNIDYLKTQLDLVRERNKQFKGIDRNVLQLAEIELAI